jgi:hypothetical protein
MLKIHLKFEQAVLDNDLKNIKLLLNNPKVDICYDKNYAISTACQLGYIDIVKLLLEDGRADPSDKKNFAIGLAAEGGYIDIVKILLNDKRVNPTDVQNYAIRRTTDEAMIQFLWNEPRIHNSLRNDNYELYSELIKKDIKNKIKDF